MRRKLGKNLCSLFLTLTMILGLFPGMSMTAYAASIDAFGGQSVTISSDQTCTSFYVLDGSTLTVNQGVTLTLNMNDGHSFNLFDNSNLELHGTLAGSVGSGATWMDNTYINVYLSDGAKYTVTGLSCMDGDNCLRYYGYDAATDGNGTVSVMNGTTDVTASSIGYKTTTYTFTATPSSGYRFVSWTKGASGEVLGTDASINVTCEQNGQYQVYANFEVAHTHSFTYSASGDTITATCSVANCTLTDSKATLTIAAPALTTYGGTGDATATLTGLSDFNTATGKTIAATDIKYVGRDSTTYEESTTAPTDAGKYTAKITVEDKTASVDYEIAKADPTAPTGLTATYGQKLSDVALTTGWTWADSTQSVGSVGSNTFKANFAGNDNYNSKSNVDLTVTVSKAANPATVTNTATVTMGGNTVDLATNVTSNGATGTVNYEFSGETNGCTLSGSVLTSGTTAGSVTVNVTVGEDSNYNALDATPITVTINDKLAQTITAADVTATYGDTDKKVTATVTDPATGGGAISYAVKTGSEDYIDVNATTGALTIKKVPADGMAYVIVTAAETNTYAQATKEVTVTINKANAVAATVTANNRTYDSTKQPLVTVTDTATGGTMQYAIGTNATAVPTTGWSASIPEETNAGTYYVWYKVAGDDDHNDSTPACVTVTISKASITPTVSITGWTYGENANDPTVSGNPGSGTVTYTYAVAGSTEFSGTVPTATGNYTVKVSIAETDNYLAGTATADFEITKAASDATAPTANDLTYTGVAQTLVTAGTATGGTMQYAIGTNATAAPTTGWSTTVPARTNAGPYYVWYKVAGDDDHNDSTPACVTVTISKASFTPNVSITGWTYGEDANTPSLSPNPGNAAVTYTYTDSQGNEVTDIASADAGTYNVKATVAESDNYLAATSGITSFVISKADIDTPSVTVSVEPWVAGEESNNPVVTGLPEGVSAEDVVFEYAPEGSDEFTSEVPSTAGNYVVKAIIPESTNYNAAEVTAALTIDPVVYNFIDSEGLSWVKGSSDTLTFTAKRNVSDNKTFGMFAGILVDGTEVAESNYTAVNGSVIVTLKSAYLNTLSVGDHTLTIRFSDGSDITTTFTVKASGVPSPATGETISIWTLMGFACIAVAGAVISFKRWKKEKV